MTTFHSAETASAYVKDATLSEATFTLAIADDFTFAGRPDAIGAGAAVVLDTVLQKGFWPDGYEQKQGYRLYRYKRAK